MSANRYHFVTVWRVAGTCGEVADVLSDATALPRWWSSVYLDAAEISPGDEHGIGRRVRLRTKGWLPYTLTWDMHVVGSSYPHGLTIVASGDFDGRGVWTIEQDGRIVIATYDWRIAAEKPLLRYLSLLMKPLFAANHRWAMREGERSLELELARRRASSEAARAAVPPPPGPVTYSGFAILGGAAAACAITAWIGARGLRALRRGRA